MSRGRAGSELSPEKAVPLVSELDKDHKKMLYDKLGVFERGFTLGVLSFSLTLACLMRFPQYYWIWHLVKGCIYIPWRFFRFFKRDLEWYCMDFCYFVTYMTFIGCVMAWVRVFLGYGTPLEALNYHLLRGGFSFANGALVMAVPLFGNKIAFHDVDNTTSLYIHLSPALFFWSLRWGGGFGTSLIEKTWPNMFHICMNMTEADVSVTDPMQALWYTGPCQGSMREFAMWPGMIWFVVWGLPYYLITFCCFKKFLEDRPQKQYLYKDTIKDTKGQGFLVTKAPECLWPAAFMLQHFTWVVFAGFCSITLWNSFVLHTVFLSAIFVYALHNGSTFMFRIVAARTVQHKLHKVVGEGSLEVTYDKVATGPADEEAKGTP